MAIRLPLKTIASFDDSTEVGAGSVGGGVPHTFTIPQDTDNIVVKFTASTVGGGVSAVFQTTDDGGTTWFDVARTSIVSRATSGSVGGTGTGAAQWLNIPITGQGFRSAVQGQNSVAGATNTTVVLQTIGSALGGSLGQYQVSGLPILSQQARIMVILTGNLTASPTLLTEIKVNSQSATA